MRHVKPWTEEDVAHATAMFERSAGQPMTVRMQRIADALGRPLGSVKNRYHNNGGAFARAVTDHVSQRCRAPEHTVAERDRAQSLGPRDLTAFLMGDPLPGRSALERRA